MTDGSDSQFALEMIALESGPYVFHELFGLQLLFEALNDLSRNEKLRKLYNFDIQKFREISGAHDLFALNLRAQMNEKDQAIQDITNCMNELTTQLALKDRELQGILNGRAWKVVTMLRKIRSRIVPSSTHNKNR